MGLGPVPWGIALPSGLERHVPFNGYFLNWQFLQHKDARTVTLDKAVIAQRWEDGVNVLTAAQVEVDCLNGVCFQSNNALQKGQREVAPAPVFAP